LRNRPGFVHKIYKDNYERDTRAMFPTHLMVSGNRGHVLEAEIITVLFHVFVLAGGSQRPRRRQTWMEEMAT
jgi:hypothetical protein